jgi:hypothetical protein
MAPRGSPTRQGEYHAQREAGEWDEQHGRLVDFSAFERDTLPLIQDVPLSWLQQATGLSLRYLSLTRPGERTPHP